MKTGEKRTGVVIAAGLGSRMGERTQELPKCMLEIGGKPLLHHTLDRLRSVGCDRLVVVVGHLHEKVDAQDALCVLNADYRNNNILHSLMCAREHYKGEIYCSYSDIWFEPEVIRRLASTAGDIVLASDEDWQNYYDGRSEHPLREAENAWVRDGRVAALGKGLCLEDAASESQTESQDGRQCHEFLGLWKMSERGAATFVEAFDEVDGQLSADAPFEAASAWRKAYITDLIQHLIRKEQPIHSATVRRGWAELDTEQDVDRLPRIALGQSLHSMITAFRKHRLRVQTGQRILAEANDLKRTPEALAQELDLTPAVVDEVIAGRVPRELSNGLIHRMSSHYPISTRQLVVDEDDTDEGILIMRADASRSSERIFERVDPAGGTSPYYAYRDTAMSRLAPFRPEWIKELRVAASNDANNPAVVFNNGHLLHQTTFFIGEVNFYWELDGVRHVAEMNTGDSNHITPFVPHSFTSRNPERPGVIVAVTYGAEVARCRDALSAADPSHLSALCSAAETKEAGFVSRLRRQMSAESHTEASLVRQLHDAGFSRESAQELLAGTRVPNHEELKQIASCLSVCPQDLVADRLASHDKVVVHRGASSPARMLDGLDAHGEATTNLEVYELARTPLQPQMKAFRLRVVGSSPAVQQHGLFEYVYNFGDAPVILRWNDGRSTQLEPGDSVAVLPLVEHSFTRPAGGAAGELVVVRVPGPLTDQVLDELSTFPEAGHARVLGETTCWF